MCGGVKVLDDGTGHKEKRGTGGKSGPRAGCHTFSCL